MNQWIRRKEGPWVRSGFWNQRLNSCEVLQCSNLIEKTRSAYNGRAQRWMSYYPSQSGRHLSVYAVGTWRLGHMRSSTYHGSTSRVLWTNGGTQRPSGLTLASHKTRFRGKNKEPRSMRHKSRGHRTVVVSSRSSEPKHRPNNCTTAA